MNGKYRKSYYAANFCKYSGLILLFVLLFFLIACSQQEFNYPARQMPSGITQDQAALSAAKEIFQRNCVYCHGHSSEGRGERAAFFQPPAPDFFENKYQSLDPAYLYWRISEGKTVEPFLSRGSVMPSWGQHFSEYEIWALVAYLKHRAGGHVP